jgi:uncharacterized DUF497 family protein
MEFEWDEAKAAANLSKHAVSFEEAKTVFDDPLYVDFYDPDHSQEESRYIIIGLSRQGRLLLVSYTEGDAIIRLISAREVTHGEREAYEED